MFATNGITGGPITGGAYDQGNKQPVRQPFPVKSAFFQNQAINALMNGVGRFEGTNSIYTDISSSGQQPTHQSRGSNNSIATPDGKGFKVLKTRGTAPAKIRVRNSSIENNLPGRVNLGGNSFSIEKTPSSTDTRKALKTGAPSTEEKIEEEKEKAPASETSEVIEAGAEIIELPDANATVQENANCGCGIANPFTGIYSKITKRNP